jgi:hypothetical protein
MVTRLLGLQEVPRPDDAADALAVALCHAHSFKADRARDAHREAKRTGPAARSVARQNTAISPTWEPGRGD